VPRNYQRKTERRTRLPKLNISKGTRGDPLCRSIELDWKRLEAAYGHPFEPDVRERISAIIRKYIWLDECEGNAPLLKDMLASIDRRINAADAMLIAMGAQDADQSELERYVDSEVRVYADLDGVMRIVLQYINGCKRARDSVEGRSKSSGFREGEAWRGMIASLVELFTQYRLHVTASNPVDSSHAQQPSPFVGLIKAIGKQLPPVRWPWPSTDAALAKAISKARFKAARGE
jgi:hypothetical protein